jgi:hypothetical protein
LKKNQLRLLATLNGTLRDDEGQACQNCTRSRSHRLRLGGEIGHRKYDCPQIKNFSANVVCRRCGQQGHFARDCKVNLTAQQSYGNMVGEGDMENQIQELMAEIGGGHAAIGSYGQTAGRIESGQANPWQQPAPVVASIAPWVCPPYDKINNLESRCTVGDCRASSPSCSRACIQRAPSCPWNGCWGLVVWTPSFAWTPSRYVGLYSWCPASSDGKWIHAAPTSSTSRCYATPSSWRKLCPSSSSTAIELGRLVVLLGWLSSLVFHE